MTCLDTTALIDLSRRPDTGRSQRVRAAVREMATKNGPLATTRFNVAELYVGIERSQSPEREEKRILQILEDMEILEFTDTAARVFGRLTARLRSIGRPSGDMDVLIAAVAICNKQALVTRNPRHFAEINELTVLSY